MHHQHRPGRSERHDRAVRGGFRVISRADDHGPNRVALLRQRQGLPPRGRAAARDAAHSHSARRERASPGGHRGNGAARGGRRTHRSPAARRGGDTRRLPVRHDRPRCDAGFNAARPTGARRGHARRGRGRVGWRVASADLGRWRGHLGWRGVGARRTRRAAASSCPYVGRGPRQHPGGSRPRDGGYDGVAGHGNGAQRSGCRPRGGHALPSERHPQLDLADPWSPHPSRRRPSRDRPQLSTVDRDRRRRCSASKPS